jgi:hypothetical protein
MEYSFTRSNDPGNKPAPSLAGNGTSVTLLSRYHIPANSLAAVTYILLMTALYYNKENSSCSICEKSVTEYPAWTYTVNMFVIGVFSTSTWLQCLRLCTASFSADSFGVQAISTTVLTINFVAACSNIAIWLFDWGGVCEDQMGYVYVPCCFE